MRPVLRRLDPAAAIRRPRISLVTGMAVTLLLTLVLGLITASSAGASALRGAGGGGVTPQLRAAGGIVNHAAPADHKLGPSLTAHQLRRPKHLFTATLLARQTHPLTHRQLQAIRQISGVDRIQTVSVGTAHIDHHRARVLAGNPASLRPWTPKLTANSNALWRSIGSGELTASFDMGRNAKLPLGNTVPVRAAKRSAMRIGAFATVGMASVDAVVDNTAATSIGLTPRNALLISAPQADALDLRSEVAQVLGKGASTTLLREVVVIRDAGEFMSRKQISTVLHAAISRLGMPYVWGATGPNSFDCSGLVQWSFAQAGITMPRVAADQFFAGPHIPLADARPGDLLFWHYDPTDPSYVSHVTIYLGNGQEIEAPHTGANVQIIPVPQGHLAGVVRVDPSVAARVGG